jgi:LDH2 family malate/lactate/ureidoglycolate dehydrogenase
MIDQDDDSVPKRPPIIITFANGEVKELVIRSRKGKNDIIFEDYLMDKDGNCTRLPGHLITILRHTTEYDIPVLFLLRNK